jgi:hypothetical protein
LLTCNVCTSPTCFGSITSRVGLTVIEKAGPAGGE